MWSLGGWPTFALRWLQQGLLYRMVQVGSYVSTSSQEPVASCLAVGNLAGLKRHLIDFNFTDILWSKLSRGCVFMDDLSILQRESNEFICLVFIFLLCSSRDSSSIPGIRSPSDMWLLKSLPIGGCLFAFLGMFFEARMFPTLAKSALLSSYHLSFCPTNTIKQVSFCMSS